MYIPKQFEVTDKDEIFSFIEANAFGQLISNVDGKLCSTHLPFLVSKDKTKLIAHLAKQNPQHLNLNEQEALITLEGAHDYISPNWYRDGGVPTWNYQAVHVHGRCKVFDDVDELREVVDTLSNKYEAAFEKPWKPEYKATMLRAIVGVEITISKIQCKYKLSQNKSSEDKTNIVAQLEALGSNKLAEEIKRVA